MYYTNPNPRVRYSKSTYGKSGAVQFSTTSYSTTGTGCTAAESSTSCTSVTTIHSYAANIMPPRRSVPEMASHFGHKEIASGPSPYECLRSACLPERMSAFPHSANPPQKTRMRTGVTVVNVYNTEKKARRKTRREPPAEVEKKRESPKKKAQRPPCLATDEERAEAELEHRKTPLPQWHDEEKRSRQARKGNTGYDAAKAKKAWDGFYGDEFNEVDVDPENDKASKKSRKQRNSGTIDVEMPDEGNKENCEKEGHECRPYYGSTEAGRIAQQSINNVLKLEKELKRLQFVAGPVLPQTRQYIQQVEAIHTDLKQFATQYRELQDDTDGVLQQRKGREATVVVAAPPRGKTPFPAPRGGSCE